MFANSSNKNFGVNWKCEEYCLAVHLVMSCHLIIPDVFCKYGIYCVEFATKKKKKRKKKKTLSEVPENVCFVVYWQKVGLNLFPFFMIFFSFSYRNQKLRSWLLTWRTRRSLKSQVCSKPSWRRWKKETTELTKDSNPPMNNHERSKNINFAHCKNILILLCSSEIPPL